MMRNRRRIRVIDPRFQWKYASLVALIVFLVSAMASVTLFFVLHSQARQRVLQPNQPFGNVTATVLCFAGGWSALMGGVVALVSLVFTHRICGVMYVLQRYFREITQGILPTIRPLRKHDEFKELVAEFEKAVGTLKQERQRLMTLAEESLALARGGSCQSESVERLAQQLQDERIRQQPRPRQEVAEPAPFLAELPTPATA